jgi:hypothetical protein
MIERPVALLIRGASAAEVTEWVARLRAASAAPRSRAERERRRREQRELRGLRNERSAVLEVIPVPGVGDATRAVQHDAPNSAGVDEADEAVVARDRVAPPDAADHEGTDAAEELIARAEEIGREGSVGVAGAGNHEPDVRRQAAEGGRVEHEAHAAAEGGVVDRT